MSHSYFKFNMFPFSLYYLILTPNLLILLFSHLSWNILKDADLHIAGISFNSSSLASLKLNAEYGWFSFQSNYSYLMSTHHSLSLGYFDSFIRFCLPASAPASLQSIVNMAARVILLKSKVRVYHSSAQKPAWTPHFPSSKSWVPTTV